jgi:hypothetical chaperone protein
MPARARLARRARTTPPLETTMTTAAIGIDFGTTNSVVALADADGVVTTRSFATRQGAVDAYRSALMFWREGRPPNSRVAHVSGPDALDMALA